MKYFLFYLVENVEYKRHRKKCLIEMHMNNKEYTTTSILICLRAWQLVTVTHRDTRTHRDVRTHGHKGPLVTRKGCTVFGAKGNIVSATRTNCSLAARGVYLMFSSSSSNSSTHNWPFGRHVVARRGTSVENVR